MITHLFSIPEIKKSVKDFPSSPGVYLMKNNQGKIVYIGKAKNLRKRISSYYRSDNMQNWKSSELIRKVARIEIMVTDNEIEAFLLESNLIKEYRPLFNIDLKDQQRYTYLRISDEHFPRLLVTRRNRIGKINGRSGKIFGPFVRGSSRYLAIGPLRKIFKVRICKRLPNHPCLEYFIKNCDAPCINNVTHNEYMQNINALAKILSGSNTIDEFIKKMHYEMQEASLKLKYEKARDIRDTIRRLEDLKYDQKMEKLGNSKSEEYVGFTQDPGACKAHVLILERHNGVIKNRKTFEFDIIGDNSLSSFLLQYYSSSPSIPYHIYVNVEPDSKYLLEQSLCKIAAHSVKIKEIKPEGSSEMSQLMNLIIRNLSEYVKFGLDPSLVELRQVLAMNSIPKCIDCFDVSNLGSSITVGSCIRFVNGNPDKSLYRRFKIKTIIGQNDFGMINEIVKRRYARSDKLLDKPDLILIDGGKLQLKAAVSALDELQLEIPCISIAKENEEIFTSASISPIVLPKTDRGLKILQAIRDEAHRFALGYNIHLRNRYELNRVDPNMLLNIRT